MLKEHASVLRRLSLAADVCLTAVAFFMAYEVRTHFFGPMRPFESYLILIIPLMVLWACCLDFFGMYRSLRTTTFFQVAFCIFKTNVASFVLFVSSLYIFKLEDVSRGFIILTFALASALILLEKGIVSLVSQQIRRKGLNYRCILLVGTGRRAQAFIERVNAHAEWGLRIVGTIDDDAAKQGSRVKDVPILGTLTDIPVILEHTVVDEVVFVVPRSWLYKIDDVIHYCELRGLKIHVAVDYFEMCLSHAKLADLHGMPLLSFETTSDKAWHLLYKRLFDVVFSMAALMIASPLYLAVAAAVKFSSKGSVLFGQERVGLNGRIFRVYKFRTMVADAEERLGELKSRNEMTGPVFKLRKDPRITPAGRWLRKFSLDELPQLWNVLAGDMSLIGPRPPLPSEVKQYDTWQRRRLSMRPGLTCLWQVNGRNKIKDFNKWVQLDLEYIDNWSLWLDFKIFFKTIPVVLFGIGAK